jgi:hypothetical protein
MSSAERRIKIPLTGNGRKDEAGFVNMGMLFTKETHSTQKYAIYYSFLNDTKALSQI